MDLSTDFFSLFELPKTFRLNLSELDSRYRDVQAQVHPDRFAAEGGAAQRLAMQWAVRVNEAHQRLKDPLKRAAYLCELAGVPVQSESNTAMPGAFLMQQMQWREELDDAETPAQLQALAADVQQAQAAAWQAMAQAIDHQQDFAAAAQLVRRLMFMQRFAQDLHARQTQP